MDLLVVLHSQVDVCSCFVRFQLPGIECGPRRRGDLVVNLAVWGGCAHPWRLGVQFPLSAVTSKAVPHVETFVGRCMSRTGTAPLAKELKAGYAGSVGTVTGGPLGKGH